jgi:hypothetical protein
LACAAQAKEEAGRDAQKDSGATQSEERGKEALRVGAYRGRKERSKDLVRHWKNLLLAVSFFVLVASPGVVLLAGWAWSTPGTTPEMTLNGLNGRPIAGITTTPPPGPTSKADCEKGGYKDFGFKNQGQCIKVVKKP